MAKIDLKKAFKTATEALDGVTNVGVYLAMAVIVVGSIIYAVTGGSITLSSGFNTVLNSLDTLISGWFTTLGSTVGTIVALVIVGVIAVLFGMKMLGGKGKKGDGF